MFRLGRVSRMTKWVGVVTMAALLLWLPMVESVVSQQPQVPKRSQIVEGIKAALSVKLTAAEGDIFDFEAAVFYTDARVTLAYIPLHPSSRSLQLLRDFFHREKVGSVSIGALYLDGDLPPLKAGIYTLKIKDKFINDDKNLGYEVIVVDEEGDEILCGCAVPRTTRRMLSPTLPIGSLLDFVSYRRGMEANPGVGVIIGIAILIDVIADNALEWYKEVRSGGGSSGCNKCPCDP